MELNQSVQAEHVQLDKLKLEQVSPPVEALLEGKTVASRYGGTVIPRYHDTMPPRYRDTIIQFIRTAVKQFGKEAATHRFTLDEKRAIAEVVYTYRKEGLRTSENEISRIGVNFLVEDYKVNGENSVLTKVLKALNQ